IGPPGSGKSTLAETLLAQHEYVGSDAIRDMLTDGKRDQVCDPWPKFYRRIADALLAGKSVVVDATNANPTYRRVLVEPWRVSASADIRVRVYCIVMCTPLAVCQARNAQRTGKDWVRPRDISRMHAALAEDPPRTDAGFDVLDYRGR